MEEDVQLKEEKSLTKIEKMILYFFIYAFIGWCLETIYALMVLGHFVKRGFLLGPICPIYGYGAILLLINLKNIKGNNWSKFFVSMIVFSAFEFFASWILEVLFNQRWWDYSDAFMNIQGRICLAFSIIWGLIGVLFSNVIHPWIEKKTSNVLNKIQLHIQRILIYSLLIIYIIDSIASTILNINI